MEKVGYGIIVSPWKHFLEKSVSLKDIINLVENSVGVLNSASMQVVNNLYLYNSKANIVQANNKSLIVLPKAEVVIDLFNNCKEDFIGLNQYANDVDYYISEILKVIGKERYVFYSLNDALMASQLLQHIKPLSKNYIEKNTKITDGFSIFEERDWKVVMDILFHGKHNWECRMSYQYMAKWGLEGSLLPYNVICYECLPYIREERDYCIETKIPIFDNKPNIDIDVIEDNKQIAIFSCYCSTDPTKEGWSGSTTAVKFLGVFRLDKERSRIENYLAFKRLSDDKLYI